MLRSRHPDEVIRRQQLNKEWIAADQETTDECIATAKEWIRRGPFLFADVTQALQSTKGSVSWQSLATLVSGNGLEIVGANTLSRYIICLLYTSPSPRDLSTSRMPSSA